MKITLSADQHWHVFKDFDRLTNEGKSFRLSLYEKSLNYVYDYNVKNGIFCWIDAGDIFHSRESISLPVLDMIGRVFNRFKEIEEDKEKNILKFFLKGNHDTHNKVGDITSLNVLSQYGEVISENCVLDLQFIKTKVHFIPWDENTNFIDLVNKEKTNLIVAHRMLKGAKSNNIILDGESLEGLDYSKFDNIFCGHVHEHQKVQDRVYYIGSLIANNFNDVDQDKGFIVYDTETKTFEKIKNPYSPKYKILRCKSLEDIEKCKMLIENDSLIDETLFYDIRYEIKDNEEIPSLEDLKNVRVTITKRNENENRIENAENLTPQVLLQKYKTLCNLDEETYEIGKQILEEAIQ